jgi:hypothetical protein
MHKRKLTPEIKQVFAEFKAEANKYGHGDPFNEINTIEMYEPGDTPPADAIVVVNTLEYMPFPNQALEEIKGLARKTVAFWIMPDALRSQQTWEGMIGKYFPHVQSVVQPTGHLWIQASATNPFGYKNVVTAGTVEGRWENLIANCKVTPDRINQKLPPHGRTAIIACYGPSLSVELANLVYETKDTSRDLISVSGSHDFLIDRGIIPDFHIECDPRPHKADNIAKGHPDVEYLLGSLVHPILMDKLKGMNITLWHPSGDFNRRIKDELEPDALFIGGGGNVGLRSLVLFYNLGYRSFSIYGMDCSFTDDGQMWAGAHAQKKNPIDHGKIETIVDGRRFITAPLYITYANAFFDTVRVLHDAEFRVFGDSLLKAMAAQMFKQAAEAA